MNTRIEVCDEVKNVKEKRINLYRRLLNCCKLKNIYDGLTDLYSYLMHNFRCKQICNYTRRYNTKRTILLPRNAKESRIIMQHHKTKTLYEREKMR